MAVGEGTRRCHAASSIRCRVVVGVVLMVGMLVLLVAGAGVAAAAEPTLPLDKVQPEMVGYAKTVATGTVVTTFTVEVIDVLSNQNNAPVGITPGQNLILFRASGPLIDRVGGVVQGMSGSPLYLKDPDDDTFKIAGAISYGFEWSDQTIAFATPIDEMTPLLAFANMSPLLPKEPVTYVPSDGGALELGGARVLKGAVVDEGGMSTLPAGVARLRPLGGLVSVSGMGPNSRAYGDLRTALEAKGFTVTNAPQPRGGGVRTASATIEPGASLGVGLVTGDTTISGIGAVTYVDGTRVLGFGHPMYWDGATNYPLLTAYVHTIVPSTRAGFKLASGLETTGTILQDRWTGVAGKLGEAPIDSTITARAACADTGSMATRTYHFADGLRYYPYLKLSLAYSLMFNTNEMAFDAVRGGTAEVTYTVNYTTGTGRQLSRSYSDRVFNSFDIAGAVALPFAMELSGMSTAGNEDVTLTDAAYEATFTAANQTAKVVDVSVGGRRIAPSTTITVTTSVLPYNSTTTQTVDATLAVPASLGYPAAAMLAVVGGGTYSGGEEEYSMGSSAARNAVARASEESSYLRGDELYIMLMPYGAADESEESWMRGAVKAAAPAPVVKKVRTDWVVSGMAAKGTSAISAYTYPSSVTYGSTARIFGTVTSLADPYHFMGFEERPKVELWAKPVGATEGTMVATTYANQSSGYYLFTYAPTSTASFWTRFVGSTDLLDVRSSSRTVPVKLLVTLYASPRTTRVGRSVYLAGGVRPARAGSVAVQWYYSGRWRTIGRATLDGSSNYRYRWVPRRRGTYRFRVWRTGDSTHASNVSRTVAVRVI